MFRSLYKAAGKLFKKVVSSGGNQEPEIVVVDPAQLKPETSQALASLLKNNPGEKFFDTVHSYDTLVTISEPGKPDHMVLQTVKLARPLVRYERKNKSEEYRYAVCSREAMAKGGEGEVFAADDSLSLDETFPGHVTIKSKHKQTGKKRIVKYLLPGRSPDKALREFSFLSCFSVFGVKKAVLANDKKSAALVMHRIEGLCLRNYVYYEATQNKPLFTLDQRIDLTIMIGEAILRVHDKGVIHSDIKPENIILKVDAKNNPQDATVIDFGMASWAQEHRIICYGTEDYMLPESRMGIPINAAERSDAYAFAVMLQKDLWPHFADANKYRDLANEHRDYIQTILDKGVGYTFWPFGRAALADMVAGFKAIRADRVEEEYQAAMREAYGIDETVEENLYGYRMI